MAYARPPTANPSPAPVTSFHTMQDAPHPGVARLTRLSGNTSARPQSGPRRYHCGGTMVTPTRKPTSRRATYQPQTAVAPRMPSTSNLYGMGPWTSIGSQPSTSPSAVQTSGYESRRGNVGSPRRRRTRPPVGAALQGEIHDPLHEAVVRDARLLGRLGEVLPVGELRVRVGLEDVDLALGIEPQVDARVAAQLEHAIDALAEVLDLAEQRVGQSLGDARLDAVPRPIRRVPLHLLGGDARGLLVRLREQQLPDGENLQPGVTEDADVELAAVDVALDDRVGAQALVDEGDALGHLVVVVDERFLRDARGAFLGERLHDERELEPSRPPHSAAHAEDGELGHRDAMVGQQLLRDALVARQHEAARVAAGVRHAEQLEVADDVLVVDRDVVEVLEQVEHRLRLELVQGVADHAQVAAHPEALHLVPQLPERADDVELGLPFHLGDVDALHVVRGNQRFVHEGQQAQLLHRATRCRPLRTKRMSWLVSTIPKSSMVCEAERVRRRRSSAARSIMSSRTRSIVYRCSPVSSATLRRSCGRELRRKLAAVGYSAYAFWVENTSRSAASYSRRLS